MFRAEIPKGHSPGGLLLHFRGKAKPSENDRCPRWEELKDLVGTVYRMEKGK